MSIITFDSSRKLDVIPIGRICLDFNPVEYFKPWPQCDNFKKYVGGSPANIAVGMARLNCKVGFIGCISDDQMGDFCIQVFEGEGIDTSNIVRARHGESMGLAFTEVTDRDHCGLIMFRDHVADLQLESSDVSEEYIKSAKMIVVSGTALAASPSREAGPSSCSISTTGPTPGKRTTRSPSIIPWRPGRRTSSWAPGRSSTRLTPCWAVR